MWVILDQEVSFSQHNIVRSTAPATISSASCVFFLAPCAIRLPTAVTLTHAFVTSRLDYCNSILVGLHLILIARLDRALRCAVRFIGRIPIYASVAAYIMRGIGLRLLSVSLI